MSVFWLKFLFNSYFADLAAQDEQIVMVDKSCQIDTKCDEMIKLKVESHFLKKKLSKCKNLNVTIKQKHFFCVDVKNDDKQLRFYTGLTWLQVMTLEFSWTLERRTIASQELTKVRAISN